MQPAITTPPLSVITTHMSLGARGSSMVVCAERGEFMLTIGFNPNTNRYTHIIHITHIYTTHIPHTSYICHIYTPYTHIKHVSYSQQGLTGLLLSAMLGIYLNFLKLRLLDH